jgi:hypothetical protein
MALRERRWPDLINSANARWMVSLLVGALANAIASLRSASSISTSVFMGTPPEQDI